MRYHLLLALGVIFLLPLSAFAAEGDGMRTDREWEREREWHEGERRRDRDDAEARAEREADEEEREARDDREWDEHGDDREEEGAEELGRTLRLQFELVPREDDDRPMAVLTATGEYALEAALRWAGGGFHYEVSGEVLPTDDEERVLLVFEMELTWQEDDQRGSLSASGSAVVALGRRSTIADLGEKTLTVRVTQPAPVPVDQEPAAQRERDRREDRRDEAF